MNKYCAIAEECSRQAYNPYSKYFVGACLVTKGGKYFGGCNIENASYGLTICAERTVFFKAISEGERGFKEIYISTPDGGFPCGACRQVMAEFCSDDFLIHLFNTSTKELLTKTLGDILPDAFRLNQTVAERGG